MVVAVRFLQRGGDGTGQPNLFDWGRRPPTAKRTRNKPKETSGSTCKNRKPENEGSKVGNSIIG